MKKRIRTDKMLCPKIFVIKSNNFTSTKQSDNQRTHHIELQREFSLITQAGFMTAAFSFSTTALFAVWQMGVNTVDTVPKGVLHLSIGVILFFLLICILFSTLALLQSKELDYYNDPIKLKKSNERRYKKIKISIMFWIISWVLVIFTVLFLALYYYVIPGNASNWLR